MSDSVRPLHRQMYIELPPPWGKIRSVLVADRVETRRAINDSDNRYQHGDNNGLRLGCQEDFSSLEGRAGWIRSGPVIARKAISSYRAVRSSSSTISLIESNPDCQKASDRISTPTSPRMASGRLEPPSSSKCKYFGTKAGPRSLYIR